MTGNIAKWIEAWLKGRKQKVVIKGKESIWVEVKSGVPQGSILGPILFTIFINDIDLGIISSLSKFADDTKLLRKVPVAYTYTLQDDLHNLYEWSTDWQLLFNKSKYRCLHVGNNNPQYDYFIGGERIETTEVEKDLGVHICKSLSSSHHVAETTKKANRILDAIRRTYTFKAKENILQLYKTLVRPILEYAQSAWSPYLQKDINKIEGVQCRALKMIEGFKNLPYPERLNRCNLLTLDDRRNRADLIQVFKFLNGYSDVDSKKLFQKQVQQYNTQNHSHMLKRTTRRINVRHYSFSQRVIGNWNNLPEVAVTAKSVISFKHILEDKVFSKIRGAYI